MVHGQVSVNDGVIVQDMIHTGSKARLAKTVLTNFKQELP